MALFGLNDASGSLPTRRVADFQSQVVPEPISGCWLWMGPPKNKFGHGAFKLGARHSRVEYAHRVAYAIANSRIPDGTVIRHDCDNPACVNPAHLQAGTRQDNIDDMVAKGRNCRGEACPAAVANDALVRKMRSLGRRLGITEAVQFGLSRQAAGDIMSRRTWKHIG